MFIVQMLLRLNECEASGVSDERNTSKRSLLLKYPTQHQAISITDKHPLRCNHQPTRSPSSKKTAQQKSAAYIWRIALKLSHPASSASAARCYRAQIRGVSASAVHEQQDDEVCACRAQYAAAAHLCPQRHTQSPQRR